MSDSKCELHESEVVGNTERLRVPGGWIYKPSCMGDMSSVTRPVFVPDPPRAELVRLEYIYGDEPVFIFVKAASVTEIGVSPRGDVDSTYVRLDGNADDELLNVVKGTPAEVAERLGMCIR